MNGIVARPDTGLPRPRAPRTARSTCGLLSDIGSPTRGRSSHRRDCGHRSPSCEYDCPEQMSCRALGRPNQQVCDVSRPSAQGWDPGAAYVPASRIVRTPLASTILMVKEGMLTRKRFWMASMHLFITSSPSASVMPGFHSRSRMGVTNIAG